MKSQTKMTVLFFAIVFTTASVIAMELEQDKPPQIQIPEVQQEVITLLTTLQDKQPRQISTVQKQQKMGTLFNILQPLQPDIPPQLIRAISGLPGFFGAQTGRVLVIPDEEVNVEQMVRLTEDMTVMSRILDKKIQPESSRGFGYGGGRGGYGGGGMYGGFMSGQFFGGAGTKGIYLENYGALFVAKVDFPLLAPADSNEPNKVDDTEDKLWRETKMEIYDPEKSHRYLEMHKEHQSGPTYDSEKVEALKSELIKALKHASNIWDLKTHSLRVVITVIGGGRSVVHAQRGYGGGYGGRGGYGGGHTVEVPTDIAVGARRVLTV